MAQNLNDAPEPNPSDIAYIERGVFNYIMGLLSEKRVTYSSPQCDFIHNEVVKDLRKRITCSIQPK